MCEFTILMPCLNEASTVGSCVNKAMQFLRDKRIDGEVLVVDNGSSDQSADIAKASGARVVFKKEKGYGNALRHGIRNAYGKYIIMGDCDESYDFLDLMPFVEQLRDGSDLVMGNRFAGRMEPGAMPFHRKYIGNPILSGIARLLFHSRVKDFHCGLRGFSKESVLQLNLQTTGMEFATEMVAMAELMGQDIGQVPISYRRDGREGGSHLRCIRDGMRHICYMVGKWSQVRKSAVSSVRTDN
ncbi:glycosyltransferase family 2 protein [Butyrivibrio sp. MB2005]|uniref:glycosyltransferase family 2 protein n=1 Tax=Butyrivibrio sp. MB2005 TaxID=1280678 RepID=UPI000416E224|nr:glycosyltransferase family 2 protein [Butyrivibrio sp. MB2005]